MSLRVSTIDVERSSPNYNNDDDNTVIGANLFSSNHLLWKDIVPLTLYTASCLLGAVLLSTYEDYDVTHTRPNPSTIRLPTSTTTSITGSGSFDFVGAATRGMGWKDPSTTSNLRGGSNLFEEWYGSSAVTLQWKPSYNDIMLEHRSERVPRWNSLDQEVVGATEVGSSKEQLQQAVLQLYHSLDELNELKLMSDDYMWDEMKERLNPPSSITQQTTTTTSTSTTSSKNEYSLPIALEYSMDILKSAPVQSNGANNGNGGGEQRMSELIGFDWGSCAWRHCGAKADAQEALAELQTDVGMLEPFECRFIIDIVERSIRDVLAVVPEDLKPYQNGAVVQVRPYEAYIPKAGNDEEGMGIDYEYSQALSKMRVDLSLE